MNPVVCLMALKQESQWLLWYWLPSLEERVLGGSTKNGRENPSSTISCSTIRFPSQAIIKKLRAIMVWFPTSPRWSFKNNIKVRQGSEIRVCQVIGEELEELNRKCWLVLVQVYLNRISVNAFYLVLVKTRKSSHDWSHDWNMLLTGKNCRENQYYQYQLMQIIMQLMQIMTGIEVRSYKIAEKFRC